MIDMISALEEMERKILQPSAKLMEDIAKIEGDIIILGVGGKMGPGIARAARQSIDRVGLNKRVIGVSRFSDKSVKSGLENEGIETIAADLLDEPSLNGLPDVANVIYLAGYKFGSSRRAPFTWAMNAYLPGRVAEKFRSSNIVAFSSGNVYPFTSVYDGGSSEEHAPAPVGEYAQSCLGRERIFQYLSEKNNTPVLIFRLNYAVDFRYGVLLEVANAVYKGDKIDLDTANVNLIWQGDANEMAIRSLLHCACPAKVLNVTGPETLSIKWLAEQFGLLFRREPQFVGEPRSTALLSNASQAHKIFGYPAVTIRQMIDITAFWVSNGGSVFNKPTHFQEREGSF